MAVNSATAAVHSNSIPCPMPQHNCSCRTRKGELFCIFILLRCAIPSPQSMMYLPSVAMRKTNRKIVRHHPRSEPSSLAVQRFLPVSGLKVDLAHHSTVSRERSVWFAHVRSYLCCQSRREMVCRLTPATRNALRPCPSPLIAQRPTTHASDWNVHMRVGGQNKRGGNSLLQIVNKNHPWRT